MPILVASTQDTGSTVALTALWLNDAADLSDCVAFEYADGRSPGVQVPGEVRTYVSGRRRLVLTSGGQAYQTYDWKLSWNTEDQRAWLVAHVGRVLCVRDQRGAKWYGTYLALPQELLDRSAGLDGCNRSTATVSLVEVTHSEAA